MSNYFFELCRLCLINCGGSTGIIVHQSDHDRREKIKECLSIVIPDLKYSICLKCDDLLNELHKFKINSIRAQHEFNEILKSVQTQEYYVNENTYTNIYEHQTNEIHDYQGMYHELHLSLDDQDSLPQIQSYHHIPEEEHQISEAIQENHNEIIEKSASIENNDDFSYDDFDESHDSFPNDHQNIDNAIDKKIEEFIQNKRNKANPKICTVCNKLFRTNYKLREHMQTHKDNPKFICDNMECQKSFKSKIGLKEHSATHTGEFNFVCEVCNKKFLLKSYFQAHKKIHSDVKNFSCTMCSKKFKSKQNLVNHENSKVHYGLKHFSCDSCQKSFTTKTNLDVHNKTSHSAQIEIFECPTCKKHFKTGAYLKIHEKTHNKELQNYICNICERSFIQLCDLKIHAKTHTNQKDFVCEICGETFTRKDSLKLHVSSVHYKESFYSCDICQKTFTRKNTLNQHRKKCLNSTNYRNAICQILE